MAGAGSAGEDLVREKNRQHRTSNFKRRTSKKSQERFVWGAQKLRLNRLGSFDLFFASLFGLQGGVKKGSLCLRQKGGKAH